MGDDKKQKRRYLSLSGLDWLLVATAWFLAAVVIGALVFLRRPPAGILKIAYLYPLGEPIHNIWIAPLADPSAAQQVTDLPMGVYDFGVSPDGHYIAYSTRDASTRQLDIFMLELGTGRTRRLTTCGAEDAECFSPVFHPDGTVIAYHKEMLEAASQGEELHISPRIWLQDIASGFNQPLAADPGMVSFSPVWSDNGTSIAFFTNTIETSSSRVGIILYNFNPEHLHKAQGDNSDHPEQSFIPAAQGSAGAIAPDGLRLIFPDMIAREGGYYSHLKLVDLTRNPPDFTDFTDPAEPIDDLLIDWHPGGAFVTVERRYLDGRYVGGFHLYNITVDGREVTPLLVDEAYSHHYFEWEQGGQYLVVQRIRRQDRVSEIASTGNRPEVWVLNSEDGSLIQIAGDAYHPRWVSQ